MTTTSPIAIGRALLVPALVLGLGLGAAGAPAGTALRWKYRAGEVWHYSMAQDTTMTTKVPADMLDLKQAVRLIVDQTWTVKAVDPSGLASLTQTVDRIRTSAELPTGRVTYDSSEAKDASSPAGPLFKMLVGAEFAFKMDPRGEISDIKLPEKMLATLRGGDEPAGAQGQFSEAGLKNMLAQMGILLPEGPVDVGGKWDRKMAVPGGADGQMRSIRQVYTYRGPDPRGAAESIDLAIVFDAPRPDPEIPVSIKSQESSGRIAFDNAAGRLSSSTVLMRVESSGRVMGKEVAQTFATTTVMTLAGNPPR